MAVSKSLLTYLKAKGVKYEVVPHKKVFTAYDLAQTLEHDLDKVVKTLLLKIDLPKVDKKGGYYILAVPASYRADFNKVKKVLKAKKVSIAAEKAIKNLGIPLGAMTPFAGFHKLDLLLDNDNTTPEETIKFLQSKIPTLDLMVIEERRNLKEDLLVPVF